MQNFYLPSTNDMTDRTKEIETRLRETGACRLGAGVYYVKNIVMPEDSMIAGEGIATRLILIDDTEECFVIKMASRCVIKDLHLIQKILISSLFASKLKLYLSK